LRVALVFNDDAALAGGSDDDRLAIGAAVSQADAVRRGLLAREFVVGTFPICSDLVAALSAVRRFRPDVIFNGCESFAGSARAEAAVAAALELLGVPLTGSPAHALYLAQDKFRARAQLAAAGVPVAPGCLLQAPLAPMAADLRFPLFVKPRYEDASQGISAANVCLDEPALRRRAAEIVRDYGQAVIVEEFLPGREFSVGLLGQTLLPVRELLLPGEFGVFSFAAKWLPDSNDNPPVPAVCPAALSAELQAAIEAASLGAFAALDCRGFARVDLRLDRAGRVMVLEVNPNPDLSPEDAFAASAAVAGIDYPQLVERIVSCALARSAA
jgi:D-alanine-D-alanine ligase